MVWSNQAVRDRLGVEKSHSLSLSIRVEDRLHRDIIQALDECWMTIRSSNYVVGTVDTDAEVALAATQVTTVYGKVFLVEVQASELNLDPELEWFYDISYLRDGYSLSLVSGELTVGANVTNRGAGETFTGGSGVFSMIATVQDRALLSVTSTMPLPQQGITGLGVYVASAALAEVLNGEVVIATGDIESYGRELQTGDILFSSVTNEWLAYVVARTFTGTTLTSVTARTVMQIQGPSGAQGIQGIPGPPGASTVAISTDPGNLLVLGTDDLILMTEAAVQAAIPLGTIWEWAGQPADLHPSWRMCDGSVYSPTTYPAFFAQFGTAFGGTSEAPLLPKKDGRVSVGLDLTDPLFNAIGKTGGAKTHTLSVQELPAHTHTQDPHTHTQDPHTHTQDPHTHTQDPHTHGPGSLSGFYQTRDTDTSGTTVVGGIGDRYPAYDLNASPGSVVIDAGSTGGASSINQNATAVNQNATAVNQNATAVNQNTGGGLAHNNLPPFIVWPSIIKVA